MAMASEPKARDLKAAASAIFNAAIRAVDPQRCVTRFLRLEAGQLHAGQKHYDLQRIQRVYLIGVGKASAVMARSVEMLLGERIAQGLVITKYGHGVPLKRCRLMEAGHPLPDENGVKAADALLDLVAGAGPDDLILCMISGGGSALAPAPAHGTRLADKQATTRLLLGCGATIGEINALRKHLSRIKGGGLCRHANGAHILSLILSDVVGDALDVIASGMTTPDPSTFGDCLEILERYRLMARVPASVRSLLSEGHRGWVAETPKPGDAIFANACNRIVGSIADALSAAENQARCLAFRPLILSSTIQGEAREVAQVLSAVAREAARFGRPVAAPCCILSGGETTVTLRGHGLGGRNMELALAVGISLAGASKILLLSAGTDGTDGSTDAAGAFSNGTTVSRAQDIGLSAAQHLADNDSYRFFKHLGDLFVTGPTRTNVMDLQIILLDR
jgi:glycerate 2-kinase